MINCTKLPGSDVTIIPRRNFRELHLTLRRLHGESPAMLFKRLADLLQHHNASVVKQDIFGSVDSHHDSFVALKRFFGDIDWPVTSVEGHCCAGSDIAGTQVFAVANTPVQTVIHDNRPIARSFFDGPARHVLFGDIRPTDISIPKTQQARQTFENLQSALKSAGLSLSNLVRTWLFMEDILSWYVPFNTVRTQFFHETKIFDGLLPASTGVGARNPAGAAMCLGAWALESPDASTTATEVGSPLQCAAPKYGSSFSRAVELASPDCRRLLISGTASIAPGGATAHVGDVDAQVALTMDVVQAILASRNMAWSDVTRAVAYFSNPTDAPAYKRYCAAANVPQLPIIVTCDAVCRDDLLYEIELDAIKLT